MAGPSLNRKETKCAKLRKESSRNFAHFVSLRLSEGPANQSCRQSLTFDENELIQFFPKRKKLQFLRTTACEILAIVFSWSFKLTCLSIIPEKLCQTFLPRTIGNPPDMG